MNYQESKVSVFLNLIDQFRVLVGPTNVSLKNETITVNEYDIEVLVISDTFIKIEGTHQATGVSHEVNIPTFEISINDHIGIFYKTLADKNEKEYRERADMIRSILTSMFQEQPSVKSMNTVFNWEDVAGGFEFKLGGSRNGEFVFVAKQPGSSYQRRDSLNMRDLVDIGLLTNRIIPDILRSVTDDTQ